ncbi:Uncharacterized protein TCM_041995 [Theobroma cacao]|uniref:Uncharacterized protein n=1 Tax=Theobroma cacao TaxID=3641 RepID=A0A061GXS6_THECC|nr:Uncharacterized protein TCM_041995 [Theobroma cacao]
MLKERKESSNMFWQIQLSLHHQFEFKSLNSPKPYSIRNCLDRREFDLVLAILLILKIEAMELSGPPLDPYFKLERIISRCKGLGIKLLAIK